MDQRETQTSAESRVQSSPAFGMSSPVAEVLSPDLDENTGKFPPRNKKAISNQATIASETNEDHDIGNETHNDDRANRQHQVIDLTLEESEDSHNATTQDTRGISLKRSFGSFVESVELLDSIEAVDETTEEDNSHLIDSQETSVSAHALETRRTAFNSVLHEFNSAQWSGLLSTTNNHTHKESELGEE